MVPPVQLLNCHTPQASGQAMLTREALKTPSRFLKPLRFVLIFVVAVIVLAGMLLASKWPWTESKVKSALEKATGTSLRIESFRTTYFPPGCVIGKITAANPMSPRYPPVFAATSAVIRTSYAEMLSGRKSITLLAVTGMHVSIPPRGMPRNLHPRNANQNSAFVIDRVVADDGIVEFLSGTPGKGGTRLDVRRLELDNAAKNESMAFHAAIRNMAFPGEVHSAGHIGPWRSGELSATPVSGTFTLQNANLDFLKGVSGKLNTQGKFSGDLGEIHVEGTANVPDFQVIHSSHHVNLSSNYRVVTNATTGDSTIEDMKAHWNQTTVDASGRFEETGGRKGRTLFLNTEIGRGRLEDLLLLFTSRPEPSMRGGFQCKARIELPPNPPKFLERVMIVGDFRVEGSRFTNPHTQDLIDKLDRSAAGEKKSDAPAPVYLSALSGHVAAHGGTATLSRISMVSAGSRISADGSFGLVGKTINLNGLLQTQGKLSDTTGGLKSLMLKVISPLWRHRNSTMIVPFRITGTAGAPHFAVEMKRASHH